ncbi:MAG: tetratricopeptide repeat protein [Chloroflexota bacterium]
MDTLRILVSGITEDMALERDALSRALVSLRIPSVHVEIEYADERLPRADILNRVYGCGIYLGVYERTRYGRILPTDDLSVTELEFNSAQEQKKPTLIFIRKASEIERASARQEQFLERVVASGAGNFGVFDFDDPEQLVNLVAGVVQELLVGQFHLQVTRPPFQVPRVLETYAGREDVFKQVVRALAPGKPVIIHGRAPIGGLGKTELAIRLAHQLREQFPDGILWANIPTARPIDTLAIWARAYGGLGVLGHGDLRFEFRPLPLEARQMAEVNARVDALRERLRGKRVLAILDGVVDERDDEQLTLYLRALRDCTVIVTSRVMRLPALDTARASAVEVPRMTDVEAWELFTRIVGSQRLAGEHIAFARIGQMLDWMPLALDLIACQLREHPTWSVNGCAQMIEEERARLESLKYGYTAARGVQTAMNVSHQNLNPEEQKFFTCLGTFVGDDFDADAARYVTETTRATAHSTLNHLKSLSLVREKGRLGRYTLHPVLRLFAHTKLEDAEADWRMATYYCALAKEQGRKLQGNEFHGALSILDTELSNIVAAHTWARSRNNRMGWELCRDFAYGAMTYYFNLKAMWSDWIAWSTIGIEACQKLGDEHSASSIAGGLGMVYYRQKDLDQASEFYKAALAIMEKLGDASGIATIHMNLGNVQTEKQQWQAAIDSYAKSLQIHERLGDMRGLAQTRANMGMLYAKYGDKLKARANFIQALEMFVHLDAEREADIVRKWLNNIAPRDFR